MTTGRVNRQARIPTQRREATRRLRERRRQNWILALAAFVVLVIIAIPAVGFYLRFVVPPKQVIVSVNDVNRTMGQLVDRARARVATQVESGGQPQIANVPFDVLTTLILSAIVLITTLILYKQFLFISFDPKGAKVAGLSVRLFDNIFLVVLSLSIIGSIQSVGIILVLSMLITPAAAAKLITKTFSRAMMAGSVFGVIASLSGLYLSYYLDFPSGPSMALAATSIFIIVWIVKRSFNYAN